MAKRIYVMASTIKGELAKDGGLEHSLFPPDNSP